MSSSQLTSPHIFQRGRLNHQPGWYWLHFISGKSYLPGGWPVWSIADLMRAHWITMQWITGIIPELFHDGFWHDPKESLFKGDKLDNPRTMMLIAVEILWDFARICRTPLDFQWDRWTHRWAKLSLLSPHRAWHVQNLVFIKHGWVENPQTEWRFWKRKIIDFYKVVPPSFFRWL